MSTSQQTASWSELFSGKNGIRAVALCGGVVVHAINVYIVTTIMPSVVQDLGGLEYYAWNTTLFIAASILGSALSSSAIGRLGLRSSYLSAILIFILGSMGAAMTPSMTLLLVARTIQGLGGGLLLGLSFASVRMVFAPRFWPRTMALISSMWGVATLAGPAVGGIFAESGAWRLAFWSTVPVAVGVALLVNSQLKTKKEQRESRLVQTPILKIVLLTLSVLVLSFGSLTTSWPLMMLCLVVVVSIIYGIARDDLNGNNPLFPSGTYSLKQPLGSLYAGIGLMSIGVTSEVFIPYFLQHIHGIRPFAAGYMTALMSAGWTTGSILMSGRSRQFANKLLIISPLLSALCLAILGVLMPWQALSLHHHMTWVMFIPLFGVGLGVGMIWPHLSTRVFLSTQPGQENMASAAITTLQMYAMSIGAALAGMITTSAGFNTGTLAGAQRSASWLLLCFALMPIIFVCVSKAARQAGQPTEPPADA
ncbi:MAG TPA: MFS transporter [Paenalcaligenes hominis]|uniref:MFS transporter n=1 Tax=Paenalcaligenes hominis TaxID=643674 RepID=A0A9D2VFR6_9BURK|nr:MFS transporter [Paenalcaligenes hominis]